MKQHTASRRRRVGALRRLLAPALAVALVGAACGSDEPAAEPAPATDAPAATEAPADTEAPPATEAPADTAAPASDGAGGDDSGEALDLRVVSLSPTHTEMMFAIGADELLVAVDSLSNHPAAAADLPNELSAFEPNVEAIAAYEPDLVLIGGDFTGLTDQLAAVGIAAWDGPAASNLGDVYDQIAQLGEATGHAAEADALIAQMESEIAAIVASVEAPAEPLTYYHELDPTLFSVDSSTFIGQMYSLLGLRNIADQVEGDHFGFPQLNAEFIVAENPDLIFLADTKCCGESAATVAERPGWESIDAVTAGHVFELDDDIASRWGPRVVEFLRVIADAVSSV